MIQESRYWKEPLRKTAKRLRTFKTAHDLCEKDLAKIERDIFIGFYSVRKLFDSVTKIADETKSLQIKISWYPNLKPVNWWNHFRIENFYDLNQKHQETRDITFISGRIIHSFIYIPCIEEDGRLSNILFTSDTDKNKKLYEINIDDVVTIFDRVGNDYSSRIYWKRHSDGKEKTTVS